MKKLPWIFTIKISLFLLVACSNEPQDKRQTSSPPADELTTEVAASPVEIAATEYGFEAPDTIPSGWTRIRFINNGAQHHFVLIYRLPDGKTIDDIFREISPGYDTVMQAIQSDEVSRARAIEMLGEHLPEWAFQYRFKGGVGLTAPGTTAEAQIFLDEIGVYVMECYVKSPDGKFHSSMGMIKKFNVTAENSGINPPKSTVQISLSRAGIKLSGRPDRGKQIFEVNFAEDPDGPFPYDVHLIKLDDQTNLDTIVYWMDWLNKGGLRAPAPTKFLGGVENTPAGNQAYFEAELTAGRYLLISEIDAAAMHLEFSVE